MRMNFLISATLLIALSPIKAMAIIDCSTPTATCPISPEAGGCQSFIGFAVQNCADMETKFYGVAATYNCKRCRAGFLAKRKTLTVPEGACAGWSVSFYDCVCPEGTYVHPLLNSCQTCPASSVGGPVTSPGGSRPQIEDCYIPKNNEISDTTGVYIYTSDCHYTLD